MGNFSFSKNNFYMRMFITNKRSYSEILCMISTFLQIIKSISGWVLLSYDFSHNICIGLFHDKKCCNCINLFPCIFVGFICNGFSI